MSRFPRKRLAGFTLIELLTVSVIIGILAAMGYANFIKTQSKAKNAVIVENMHTAQLASESYASDNCGVYASDPTGLSPYYPGGSNQAGGTAGTLPPNPYTGASNDPLYQESIKDTAGIIAARKTAPGTSPGSPGKVGYNQCDPKGTSYCITGTDGSGLRLGSNGVTMVLSNQ